MELIKTSHTHSKGIGKLDKVLLKCNESNYYKLTEFLFVSSNTESLVLRALYHCEIDVVLKFGIEPSIEKEYETSLQLDLLPNFIKYFCMFKCNDNIKNIINNKETLSNYKICHYGTNPVKILVMKYYPLGSVENYPWDESNFNLLKNIMKQVIFSTCYAYETKGFLHMDLHSGNVLLKPKRNDQIIYGEKILEINELEAIQMDFEKSKLNQTNKPIDLAKNILKFITSLQSTCLKNNLFLSIDTNKIIKLKSVFDHEKNYYEQLENIIENSTIFE